MGSTIAIAAGLSEMELELIQAHLQRLACASIIRVHSAADCVVEIMLKEPQALICGTALPNLDDFLATLASARAPKNFGLLVLHEKPTRLVVDEMAQLGVRSLLRTPFKLEALEVRLKHALEHPWTPNAISPEAMRQTARPAA